MTSLFPDAANPANEVAPSSRELFYGASKPANAVGDVVPRIATDFYKVGNPLVVRQPARILFADLTAVATPTTISDVISLTPGVTLYNAQPGWTDLGVTRGGVRLMRSLSEEGYGIDPNTGYVTMLKSISDVTVEGAMADMTVERMGALWRNEVDTTPGGDLRVGGGLAVTKEYLRRIVICHPIPSGKIRMYVFPVTSIAAVENSLSFAKSGEQQTLAFKIRAHADPDELRLDLRYFFVLERAG